MNQDFLSVTSFLDPRFQNLTKPNDYTLVKAEIQRQYEHMGLDNGMLPISHQTKSIKKESKLSTSSSGNAFKL